MPEVLPRTQDCTFSRIPLAIWRAEIIDPLGKVQHGRLANTTLELRAQQFSGLLNKSYTEASQTSLVRIFLGKILIGSSYQHDLVAEPEAFSNEQTLKLKTKHGRDGIIK